MRGVGKGSQKASKFVHLVGALHDGGLLGYSTPVLDEDPEHPEIACIPPLYGLDQLSGMNSYFDSRGGKIVCIPEGKSVDWPPGTRVLQCEKGASGHWLLGVGHWDKVQQSEIQGVLHILNSGGGQSA